MSSDDSAPERENDHDTPTGRRSGAVKGVRSVGRRRLADSTWGVSQEVIGLLGTLLAFTLLGRTLGAGGYGEYASLYAIVGPMVTLAASGVTLTLLQFVVRDGASLEETLRSCVSVTIAFGLVLTAIGTVIAFAIVDSLGVVAIVSILSIEFLTAPLVGVAASTVQARETYAASVKLRLALVVSRIAILVVLFAFDALTVASLGVSQLAFSVVFVVISYRWLAGVYSINVRPGRVRATHLRSNFVFSAAISADAIGNDGDKVVLAANGYTVDTGLYAAAYRIIGLGQAPVGVLVNMSHRRFLEHEPGRRREHLDLAIRYSLVSGTYGLVFGVFVFFAAPAFPLIMGDEFEGSVEIMRWLAPIVFFRSIGIFSLNGLMGLGLVGLRTIVIVANAAFGVVLFLLFIPDHGWKGAVAASLICEAMQVIMTWSALIICQRRADRAMDRDE